MLKKQLIVLLAVFMTVFSGICASAENECSKESFMTKITALSRHFNIDYDYEYNQEQVIKQDAVRMVYEVLVAADSQFEITSAQADDILNTCYDNAYLKEENKTAYASMIRHGVIGVRGLTNPDKVLTEENADLLISRVYGLFEKKLPITIGGNTVSIGSSIDEMYNKFGEPSRIEKSEYEFDWYIYNSSYKNFIMIGIKDDIVCAYFTNGEGFEYETGRGLEVIRNTKGEAEAVYYISGDMQSPIDREVHGRILNDIINAHRAKYNLVTFISKSFETIPALASPSTVRSIGIKSASCISVYANMLKLDNGDGVLSRPFGTASQLYSVGTGENMWQITAVDSGNTIVSIKSTVEVNREDLAEDLPLKIKKPQIISPIEGETVSGPGIKLSLAERCAKRYLVTLFNLEKESNDVFAYIEADMPYITIPSYMLTEGNVYKAVISAVDGDEQKESEQVVFVYSQAVEPLRIIEPQNNISTYEDEIHVEAYSSAYKNFRIDVYDKENTPVLTKELKGESECNLESLPQGKYFICVTSVSNATDTDKAQSFVTVEIKEIIPQIKEYILNPGERFDFYYGDGKQWLYFYDTETVAVSGGKITTVTGDKENSLQILPEGAVLKTRVTQRKVPATEKFKALRELLPKQTSVTGAYVPDSRPTETGNAIASLALSYKGVPYVWGGATPSGFDCSGLVKYVCNSLGIKVERTSSTQFASSGRFVEKNDLIPGDLVFFQSNGKIHHVGIYIGNGQMVHAPQSGETVKVSSINEGYYKREYAGAKRVSQ